MEGKICLRWRWIGTCFIWKQKQNEDGFSTFLNWAQNVCVLLYPLQVGDQYSQLWGLFKSWISLIGKWNGRGDYKEIIKKLQMIPENDVVRDHKSQLMKCNLNHSESVHVCVQLK